jgi:hypothetical protein
MIDYFFFSLPYTLKKKNRKRIEEAEKKEQTLFHNVIRYRAADREQY